MPQGRFTQASFGKRGTAAAGANRTVRPTASPAEAPEPAPAGPDQAIVAGPGKPVSEHALWSYFKACVAAFAIAVMLSGFFVDSNAPAPFVSRIFINFVSAMVMMTLAPMLLIPIRILGDVFRLLRVPRGASDIVIGGLVGSLMMLPSLHEGEMPEPLALCFTVGGLVGGFVYWRARGYPGLGGRHRQTADRFGTVMDTARRQL